MTACHRWRALRLMSVSSLWWVLRASVLTVLGSPPSHRCQQGAFWQTAPQERERNEIWHISPLSKSFQSCPLLPQTKIQIQIFLFCFPSFFVCRVLVPLSCSGELKEELFLKQPEWECAYASVWVHALFHTLQPFTSTSFASPLSLSYFLPNRRQVLIVRNTYKKGTRWF